MYGSTNIACVPLTGSQSWLTSETTRCEEGAAPIPSSQSGRASGRKNSTDQGLTRRNKRRRGGQQTYLTRVESITGHHGKDGELTPYYQKKAVDSQQKKRKRGTDKENQRSQSSVELGHDDDDDDDHRVYGQRAKIVSTFCYYNDLQTSQ